MKTKKFVSILKEQRAWDFAPTLNLFGCCTVPLLMVERISGIKYAVLVAVSGLIVAIYCILKDPVRKAFISWWNDIPFYIHFVFMLLWASLSFAMYKGILFSKEKSDLDIGNLEKS